MSDQPNLPRRWHEVFWVVLSLAVLLTGATYGYLGVQNLMAVTLSFSNWTVVSAPPCPPEAKDDWFKVVSFDGKTCVLDGTQTSVPCPSYDYQPPPPPPAIDAAEAVAAQLRRWKI